MSRAFKIQKVKSQQLIIKQNWYCSVIIRMNSPKEGIEKDERIVKILENCVEVPPRFNRMYKNVSLLSLLLCASSSCKEPCCVYHTQVQFTHKHNPFQFCP